MAGRDDVLRRELRAVGRDRDITSIRRLSGGYVADAWLITYADGIRVAGKTLTGAPADLFRAEADGLATLRATGHLPTPRVLAVTDRLLLLEALAARDDSQTAWEAFAHDLAALHRGTVHHRFGWARDGYLGRVAQRNTWTPSGHEFFAQHRLLRYLEEPLVQHVLTPGDRRALERFCDRLAQIIPAMPAVLTHGDLYAGTCSAETTAASPSSTPPSATPGPRSTCPCCGAAGDRCHRSASSTPIRNSTPPRPAGKSACRCCTYASS